MPYQYMDPLGRRAEDKASHTGATPLMVACGQHHSEVAGLL